MFPEDDVFATGQAKDVSLQEFTQMFAHIVRGQRGSYQTTQKNYGPRKCWC